MAFSESFIAGLRTKSEGFQQKFYGLMDALYEYCDNEKEIDEFQDYFESQISYENPGNQIYSLGGVCGGTPTDDRKQEYFKVLFDAVTDLFQEDLNYGTTGALAATHFFIGIRAPEGMIDEPKKGLLQIVFDMMRSFDPPEVIFIESNKNVVCFEYLIAVMK